MVSDSAIRWFEEQPHRWKSEQSIANRLLTNAEAGIGEDGHAFIDGGFSFDSECGHRSDDFQLKIVYPDNFPKRKGRPDVYLQSHRKKWQNGRDSHIESNWRLCLGVAHDSTIDFENERSLEQLLGDVATFLVREEVYQRTLIEELRTGTPAKWPGPDRSHDVRGLVESIEEQGEPGRNDPCVCGSGKKYKNCHWNAVCRAKQDRFIEKYRLQRGKKDSSGGSK